MEYTIVVGDSAVKIFSIYKINKVKKIWGGRGSSHWESDICHLKQIKI